MALTHRNKLFFWVEHDSDFIYMFSYFAVDLFRSVHRPQISPCPLLSCHKFTKFTKVRKLYIALDFFRALYISHTQTKSSTTMHKCSQTHSVQQHALTHTQGIPQTRYARSWSGQVHSQVTVLRRCLLGRCYTAHQPTPGTATCTSLLCSCHPTRTFSKLSHWRVHVQLWWPEQELAYKREDMDWYSCARSTHHRQRRVWVTCHCLNTIKPQP